MKKFTQEQAQIMWEALDEIVVMTNDYEKLGVEYLDVTEINSIAKKAMDSVDTLDKEGDNK